MKKSNKSTTILFILVLGIAAVGVLGFATKGFKDFKLKKTAYEKQIEKYDVKETAIKTAELSFDEKTNEIASKHFVYIHDSVDIKEIEMPNTYGGTFAASYDMTAIRKANGAYASDGAEQIFHYEEYAVFSFLGASSSGSFKLKKTDGTFHDLTAISYVTHKLVVPLTISDDAKTAYEAKIEKHNIKEAQIKENKLSFNKEDNIISQDSNSKCFLYIHDSVDIKEIEIPNTYGETFAASYDMVTIRKTNGLYLKADDSAVNIYHYEDYSVILFQGPSTAFKLKKADGTFHDLTAISYATDASAGVIAPDTIATF